MGRHLRSLVGLALLALSLLVGVYGLFAVLYRGDSGGTGDTYVTFGGHQVDAQLAGAVSALGLLDRDRRCLDDSPARPAGAF